MVFGTNHLLQQHQSKALSIFFLHHPIAQCWNLGEFAATVPHNAHFVNTAHNGFANTGHETIGESTVRRWVGSIKPLQIIAAGLMTTLSPGAVCESRVAIKYVFVVRDYFKVR